MSIEYYCYYYFTLRCDINLTDKSGMTPLHYAVLSNSPGIVGSLLESGADVNIRDNNKMTPLQYSREKVSDILYNRCDVCYFIRN